MYVKRPLRLETAPSGRNLLHEANEPFDRAAGEVLRCDVGHLILGRNMVEGDFTVPNQFLQEKESESDMFGPRTVGGVADDVKGASVVPEKWNAVELCLESELRQHVHDIDTLLGAVGHRYKLTLQGGLCRQFLKRRLEAYKSSGQKKRKPLVDLRLSGFAPQLASQYPFSRKFPVVCSILKSGLPLGYRRRCRCRHVNLGRLAHGSCQLTDGIYDVEAAACS